MAKSNSNIIYLGTGEGFGNVDAVDGNGMYKSLNKGQTRTHLPSTKNFGDVNRAIVDPANPDIVVVATNTGIYRTINGGTSWTNVYSGTGKIQDLRMTPDNFAIQYATRNSFGVLKSIDGGISWNMSSQGMDPDGRIEIDVSPVKPSRLFASVEGNVSGNGSDLYMSDDAGLTWSIINASINVGESIDFLGSQGWYDNTIACDPYDASIIYFGGVGLYQLKIGSGSSTIATYAFNENNTSSFLTLTNFTNATHYDGKVTVGENGTVSIEVRFGPGRKQKAHRFLVPESTSGVPASEYTYQDYVDVPFEVWDVTNNMQLMISFRGSG